MFKIVAVVGLMCANVASAETFDIDPNHSSVTFRIRHFVAKVRGRFDKFAGSFDYTPGKPATWKTSAEIEAASINTNSAGRDAHLKGPDFFDVEKCPKISFKSTGVTDVKADSAMLHGQLTMHCVTHPVDLKLEFGGLEKDAKGTMKSGMTASGKLDRKLWGIEWNKANMLGDDVEIELEVEGSAAAAVRKR